MRVLLTGTEGSGIERVKRLLQAEGHQVVSCTDGTPAGERCVGYSEKTRCPAMVGVDVVVSARLHPLPNLTSQEKLAECALLADVPLIVVGSTVLNPFGGRANLLIEGFDGVIAALQQRAAG